MIKHYSDVSPRIRKSVTFLNSPARMVVAYIIALTCAEIITTFINVPLGASIHALILGILVLNVSTTIHTAFFDTLVIFMVAPLIRLLSLSLPLFLLDQEYWYIVVSLPLFIAALIIMRLLKYSVSQVGLNFNNLLFQLCVGIIGFGFGAVEYIILRPKPMIKIVTVPNLALGMVSLFIGTGLLEELLFRGIMQRASEKVFGILGSIVCTAIIFTILHIGWQSIADIVVVFVA